MAGLPKSVQELGRLAKNNAMNGEPNRSCAEAAIARVLKAEIAAKEDAARCAEEARSILERASVRAQAIAARTDARIVRMRETLRSRTAREIQALDSGTPQGAPESSRCERIERAAAALARELTVAA